MEKKLKKIIMLSGKARSGKDTTSLMLSEMLEAKGYKVITIQGSSYIKEYAKKISDWDGSEETKPRQLLQELGTSVIRKQIDELFFVKRVIDDIRVYSYYFDYVIVSDVRVKVEIDVPRQHFDNICAVNITRPNFDNGLTEEQKKHFTEIDLDDYDKFDYEIVNDGSIEDLKKKVEKFIGDISE